MSKKHNKKSDTINPMKDYKEDPSFINYGNKMSKLKNNFLTTITLPSLMLWPKEGKPYDNLEDSIPSVLKTDGNKSVILSVSTKRTGISHNITLT